MADQYTAAPDIRRMLSGTPNVMGILAAREGVRLVGEAGIDAIRTKSVALTEFLLELLDLLDVTLLSPRDSAREAATSRSRCPTPRKRRSGWVIAASSLTSVARTC